ncbi:endonuclease [Marivirga sp. S37H4]|uniref:Endonuclease n=1 Tax=Marivirga aurantiaca TaxID=2802615 RepID=A0A934WZ53_9BACT|nr:endonuclease [Marivirga aurantiaca]MBK6265684.1 endonuclease [Marivirga aurantiaca]
MRIRLLLFICLAPIIGMAQVPSGYYNGTQGKLKDELKMTLHNIIKDHTEFPYTSSNTDVWDILKVADADSIYQDSVVGIYSGFRMLASEEYNNNTGWSREHVWAQSRGELGTNKGPGTDTHNLHAEDISTNSARSNRNFDYGDTEYIDQSGKYSGPTGSFTSSSAYVWEPRDEVKGDVARSIFYMATRYEGENGEPDLELVEELQDQSSTSPVHARLSVLLEWHQLDPVDNWERRRNDVIYSYQENRNPFIDHPEFVDRIWGEAPVNPCDTVILHYQFNPDSLLFNIDESLTTIVADYSFQVSGLTNQLFIIPPANFTISLEESFETYIESNDTLKLTSVNGDVQKELFVRYEGEHKDTVVVDSIQHITTCDSIFYQPLKVQFQKTEEPPVTGSADVISDKIFVYPNPIRNSATFQVEGFDFTTLYNANGSVIFKTSKSRKVEKALEKIQPGVYYLHISMKGKLYTQKLIKLE